MQHKYCTAKSEAPTLVPEDAGNAACGLNSRESLVNFPRPRDGVLQANAKQGELIAAIV